MRRPLQLLLAAMLVAAPALASAKKKTPKAADAKPGSEADALRKKAAQLSQLGNEHAALDVLHRAEKSSPRDPAVQRDLGRTYSRMGQADDAAAHYKKFLQLAPRDPAAPEVRQALEEYQNNPR